MANAKTKVKTKIIAVPPAKAPKSSDAIVAALISLQVSEGWAIIRNNLDENIRYIESAILNGIDPQSREKLTDAEIEMLRYKRNLNLELRDTPENFIKKITSSAPQFSDGYDPYFNSADEIRKSQVKHA